jgi:hypothetical protein
MIKVVLECFPSTDVRSFLGKRCVWRNGIEYWVQSASEKHFENISKATCKIYTSPGAELEQTPVQFNRVTMITVLVDYMESLCISSPQNILFNCTSTFIYLRHFLSEKKGTFYKTCISCFVLKSYRVHKYLQCLWLNWK